MKTIILTALLLLAGCVASPYYGPTPWQVQAYEQNAIAYKWDQWRYQNNQNYLMWQQNQILQHRGYK